MTERNRRRIVELLRCAADVCAANLDDENMVYLHETGYRLGISRFRLPPFAETASKICIEIAGTNDLGKDRQRFIWVMLEAAQRVSDGVYD